MIKESAIQDDFELTPMEIGRAVDATAALLAEEKLAAKEAMRLRLVLEKILLNISSSGGCVMLKIEKKSEGKTVELALIGRLDTTTAPQLEAVVKESVADAERLVFDLAELEYVSSAGLRVLLSAQKTMNRQGEMLLIHVNENVMEIFEVTGFSDILTFG